MENKIKISIIVPYYNRLSFLEDTINSVIQQDSSCWELILVDDGSIECNKYLIERFASNKIIFTKRDKEPKGAPTCRNIGARIAKYEYLLFLDSDDLLAPWSINERLDIIKNDSDYKAFIFQGLEFDNDNSNYHRLRTRFKSQDPIMESINFRSSLQTSCIIWKYNTIEDLGFWNENLKILQDAEIHLRFFLKKNKYLWANEIPDVFIRKHSHLFRISNNKKSIEKYINFIKSCKRIESLLKKHSNYNKVFVANFQNLLFTLPEGMNVNLLKEYKHYIKNNKHIPSSYFKLILYINFLIFLSSLKVSKRLIYQFRKFGIPNFRKKFWTNPPKLTEKQIFTLKSKLKCLKPDSVLNKVHFLSRLK